MSAPGVAEPASAPDPGVARDPFRRSPLAQAVLALPAFLYRGAVRLRNGLYDGGLLKPAGLSWPVVSIGNLTVGGSGKTPVTSSLAGTLLARGFAVGIVSRGYGRDGRAPVLVSDGRRLLAGPDAAGDEPVLLARAHPGAVVAVAADRRVAFGLLPARPAPRVVLLDDAFQHRAVARDLDLLLVDGEAPFGNGRILPFGPLREPISGMRRADALVVTRGDGACPPALRAALERHHPNAPIFHARIVPSRLVRPEGPPLPLEALRGRAVFALSGIARPDRFEADLAGLGARLVGARRFPDHHRFSATDRQAIPRDALAARAEMIVTTEKDLVRWIRPGVAEGPPDAEAATERPPLVALGIEARFPREADLARFVEERLRRSPAASRGPANA
ncbi:MAG TPA: tetraacyldisaccharide 4'-kinase [Candidatus Polarisedimenticolia bacterium]|nr:tetraacyldisaccharide 4'-kinase [Candidatus Polarisedimenticolia bacterium]